VAGLSLLALLDDIASVLDDVALMTKVAAKKTAGVLGDDLALNAEQVSGVSADRELPVVWKVAKGSFRNKAILVPAALLISAIAPWLITPLLLIGGLFLCFEGAEKIVHSLSAKSADATATVNTEPSQPVTDLSLEEYEDQKVKGAIRTDFILSAEIIVIALGTVQNQPLSTQLLVVSLIAITMTVGVYGLVAGIVKMDDVGLYLVKHNQAKGIKRSIGNGLLSFAPKLMTSLATIGTVAMFLVGGSIVVHSIPGSHAMIHHLLTSLPAAAQGNGLIAWLVPVIIDALAGITAGFIVLTAVMVTQRLTRNST
jgi:predicted DNA repair protein MutK